MHSNAGIDSETLDFKLVLPPTPNVTKWQAAVAWDANFQGVKARIDGIGIAALRITRMGTSVVLGATTKSATESRQNMQMASEDLGGHAVLMRL
jgi:hypothetical protein